MCSGPTSENARNGAVVNHPAASVAAHPANHLNDGLILARECAGEDGFVMSDTVAQVAQAWQRFVHVDAPAPRIGEGTVKGGSPEGHLVIELAGGTVGEEPFPESERQLGDDAAGIERTVRAAQRFLSIGDARAGKWSQRHPRIVVRGESIDGGELAV